MFFDKKKYIVPIVGGNGILNTDVLRGMVVHLIVRPEKLDTVWDLTLLDKDGDEILEVRNFQGRLDEYKGIPIGSDSQEKITVKFSRVTANEPIKIIFKTNH